MFLLLMAKFSRMCKLVATALFLVFFTGVKAQDKILPAEAKSFLLHGYEMLDYVTGDLNGDKKTDAILILKIPGEDTATEDVKRPLLILIRQVNGKLKQEKRNDDVIMCRQCGGVFGDPYEGTEITGNGITINFYGGSSWRWGYTYKFAYKTAKRNWYLINEKQISYHNTEPEINVKEVEIPEAELGEIPFEKFNVNPPYEEAKWQVTAVKTFFYENPKLGSKPRKGYLLKGNKASQIRILKNFVELSFENGNGQFTAGFVLKKDIEKLE